jgi:photosystem II stability/assembly factor-like uncharacterized protein
MVRLALLVMLVTLVVTGCQLATSEAPEAQTSRQTESSLRLAVDATDGSLLTVDDGLFRSTNQGQSWEPTPLSDDVQPDTLRQVATSQAAPSSLFVGRPGSGILRSDDRGQAWRAITAGLPSQKVTAFAAHSFRPDTLFA